MSPIQIIEKMMNSSFKEAARMIHTCKDDIELVERASTDSLYLMVQIERLCEKGTEIVNLRTLLMESLRWKMKLKGSHNMTLREDLHRMKENTVREERYRVDDVVSWEYTENDFLHMLQGISRDVRVSEAVLSSSIYDVLVQTHKVLREIHDYAKWFWKMLEKQRSTTVASVDKDIETEDAVSEKILIKQSDE